MQKQWEEWEAAIDVINSSINKFVRIKFQRTWPSLGKVEEIVGKVVQTFSSEASPSFIFEFKKTRRREIIEIFMDELIYAIPL